MSTEQQARMVDILSIDAWADGCGGWQWNEWHKVGSVDLNELNLSNARQVIGYMRREGFIGSNSKGRVGVEDDQYNVVITERSNGRPLYAIAYGAEERAA